MENLQIEPDDIGFQSPQYEIELFDTLITITIGKPNYKYSKTNNIIFYAIYLIENDELCGQIGVFEINSKDVLRVLDEEDDIDLTKIGEPLLYSFVNKPFLQALLQQKKPVPIVIEDTDESVENEEDKQDIEEEEDEEVSILKLNNKEANQFKMTTKTNDGIFDYDKTMEPLPALKEETEQDATKNRKEYKESPNNIWIHKFMKNTEYSMVDNEGAGDCLFAVIRDAYKQIGYNTTIAKLRNLLSGEANEDIYIQYKNLYLVFDNDIKENEKEIKLITEKINEIGKQIKGIQDKKQKTDLLNEARKMDMERNKLKKENIGSQKLMIETNVEFMKNIKSFEEFREAIKTSVFWGDAWSISRLEYKLNMKMIIFSENAWNENALDNIINCGEVNVDIEEKGSFTPEFYIMTSYTGNHYKLITYKNKHIFTYREIPYDVKILITNKCMERNSGIFYLIKDFRNFKTSLGISPEEGKPEIEEGDELGKTELYDPEIVFRFYQKSENKPKPGKGSGEKIILDKMTEFKVLSQVKDWRRKLDDTWTEVPFKIDGMEWCSVEHYYQGSKFKKGFPDYYRLFSLDSQSDISKDVAVAKSAGSKTGKYKGKTIRPKDIIMDADFYGVNNVEERKRALTEKFTQNIDLKEMLIATYPAKLVLFNRGTNGTTDKELMEIRKLVMQDGTKTASRTV